MSKLDKIRVMLQNIIATFARISTDNGLLSYDGDELEVGMNVNIVDEEGNETPAPDGLYHTDDGIEIEIADGKVVAIREPEVEPETEPAAEEPQENMETAEEEPQNEEPEADPKDQRIADLEQEVARLEEELGAARERIAELEKENEDLKNKPAAEPAEAEFEKVTKVEKTGNRRLDNLTRIINAK